jgi:hypothetical protein
MSDTAEDLLLRRSKRIFAIDRRVWNAVCDLGMNEAVCYLVIASGTGGDQRTSSWSATAIEKYMGIHHRRAKEAIQRLEGENLVTVVKKGSLRRYSLQSACAVPTIIKKAAAGRRLNKIQEQEILELLIVPEWIWLPNSIIEGANDEVPPVKLLRQTQEIAALRLFINLYYHHDLVANGGLEWRPGIGIRATFDREHKGSYGNYQIWSFTLSEAKIDHDADFYVEGGDSLLSLLFKFGLVEFVNHLVESNSIDAEIHRPQPALKTGEVGEQEITIQAQRAARLMAPYLGSLNTMLVPVVDNLPNVQLVGIVRLKYRPHTSRTAQWLSKASEWKKHASGFEALADEIEHSGIKVVSR